MDTINTAKKPAAYVTEADWVGHYWNLKSVAETKQKLFEDLKYENRQKLNEAAVTAEWALIHNNLKIADRIKETKGVLRELDTAIRNIEKEMSKLKTEKIKVEEHVENLTSKLEAAANVMYLRDHRLDLVLDDVDKQLQAEVRVLEWNKALLTSKSADITEFGMELKEFLSEIRSKVDEKAEALEKDQAALKMDKTHANISHKFDVSRKTPCLKRLDSWREAADQLLVSAADLAEKSAHLVETTQLIRCTTDHQLAAQFDSVNLAFRKKIFDTKKQNRELEFQRKKLIAKLSTNEEELKKLRYFHQDTRNGQKVAETRAEMRNHRPCAEQVEDEAQTGLLEEISTLKNITKEVGRNERNLQKMGNQIEILLVTLDESMARKQQGIDLEQKAYDEHEAMCKKRPISQIDRNIALFQVEQQWPPEVVTDVNSKGAE